MAPVLDRLPASRSPTGSSRNEIITERHRSPRWVEGYGIRLRLPDVEGDKPENRKFKAYPIGYFHIDIAEVRTEEGKLYLFVAIDRRSKFASTELHEKATTHVAADFRTAMRALTHQRTAHGRTRLG